MAPRGHYLESVNPSEHSNVQRRNEFDIEAWLAELIAAQFLREFGEGADDE